MDELSQRGWKGMGGSDWIAWIKPLRGWMKLNVDGDFYIGMRIFGAEVLRNDLGVWN